MEAPKPRTPDAIQRRRLPLLSALALVAAIAAALGIIRALVVARDPVRPLIRDLSQGTLSERQAAAEALNRYDPTDPRVPGALLDALEQPDPAVRAAAARSLGMMAYQSESRWGVLPTSVVGMMASRGKFPSRTIPTPWAARVRTPSSSTSTIGTAASAPPRPSRYAGTAPASSSTTTASSTPWPSGCSATPS